MTFSPRRPARLALLTLARAGWMADDYLGLARTFYPQLDVLGHFTPLASHELPEPQRSLLAHEHHMTVTVERHHGGPVDVRVLDARAAPDDYARVILLVRRSDSQVVQFGVMRIDWSAVDRETRAAIEREDQPLGRILIERGALRTIHPLAYYRVACGSALRTMLGVEEAYGRAARIDFNGRAAVELIEILP